MGVTIWRFGANQKLISTFDCVVPKTLKRTERKIEIRCVLKENGIHTEEE